MSENVQEPSERERLLSVLLDSAAVNEEWRRRIIADEILAAGFGDVARAKAEALEDAASAIPVQMMTFHSGAQSDLNANRRDPLLARAAAYRSRAAK